MDVKLINPFLQAAINVLTVMAMTEVKPGKPYIRNSNAAKGDVSGVIGLTGKSSGTIAVTFTEKCAIGVVNNMLGENLTKLGEDVIDAVGEITNMISGQARKGLAEVGIPLQGSTPTVITGKGHTISHITKGPILAIPFATQFGEFTVEVCFE